MAIASLPMGVPPNLFYYRETVSTSQENWSLATKLIAAGWDQTQRVDVYITINQGVLIGSSSNAACVDFGTMPEGSVVVLENHGRIIGKGGKGGNGGNAGKSGKNPTATAGGSGGTGGNAFRTRSLMVLKNFGEISGGGGGGGGGAGAAGRSDPAGGDHVDGFAGGGGGGGEGYRTTSNRGVRGSNTTDFLNSLESHAQGHTRASHGQNGTTTSRGAGGNGGWWHVDGGDRLRGGDAGNGGTKGNSGGSGQKGRAQNIHVNMISSVTPSGGSGGSGGKAIDGKSYITFSATGNINGAQVN